jgi:replicative DNA helicase
LRESGAIEQDADVVIFIYRPELYRPDDDSIRGIADINIAKQRNGPTGRVNLAFIREYARFADMEFQSFKS